VAEAVTQFSRQGHHHCHCERVDRHCPGRPEDIGSKIPGQMRKRNSDHRHIQRSHQNAQTNRRKCKRTRHAISFAFRCDPFRFERRH